MILQRTCIPAGNDDDLSGQIRDVVYAELAPGRKGLWDKGICDAHGFDYGEVLGKKGTLHNNILNSEKPSAMRQ